MKKYFFISGLPRSGNTLLSAILNQNPQFYSGPSSPVLSTMLSLEQSLSSNEYFLNFPKPDQAANIIANVINIFYSDINKPVIFDKNLLWTSCIHYIKGYFNVEPKILCPVRNIDEILSSYISLFRKNPYNNQSKINIVDEILIKNNITLTNDARCEFIASQNGMLGQSYNGIRQALINGNQKYLHFIEYDNLVNNPENTLKNIYEFLDIEYYKHNFDFIEHKFELKDLEIYGLNGFHEVRTSLHKTSENPKNILSDKILEQCNNIEFWREINSEYNEYENSTNEESNIIG